MRSLLPDATLGYFSALHHAFYVGNRDVTDPTVLASLAEPFGVAAEIFATVYEAEEIGQATMADFRLSQALGVTGFPAVLLRENSEFRYLTLGYQPFKDLKAPLDAWFAA